MWMSGILTAIGLIFIVGKFSTDILEKMLGNMAIVVDILATYGVMLLFAATGTISGTMAAVTTGIAISIILLVRKQLGFYQDFGRKEDGTWGWTRKSGDWTLSYVIAKFHSFGNGFPTVVNDIKQSWDQDSNVVPIRANA